MLWEVLLHLDQHLRLLAVEHAILVYAALFLTVFIETGLVLAPFLPGDSLLFVAGTLAGIGVLDPGVTATGLVMAAITGNQTNFLIGRFWGKRVQHFSWFQGAAFEKTKTFFHVHGAMTLILARFIPFVRTFAPFVAGLSGATGMPYRRFVWLDVLSALLWVGSLVGLGYWIGQTALVQHHLQEVMVAFVVIPLTLFIVTLWRQARSTIL